MDTFERLEKMLEIVEAMKKNICEMMDAEVKTRLRIAALKPQLVQFHNGRDDERPSAATDV